MDGVNTAAREAAARYCAEGWRIVPIPYRSKRPIDHDWPDKQYLPEQVTGNVGVLLGPASNGLVDVDLDSYWSLRLAPHYLPETARFGRESKRGSHRLYYCPGVRNRKFTFAAAAEAQSSGKQLELVELRAQNASNDRCAQTVFPGSVHECGEPIEWDSDCPDAIATIERGELIWRVTRLTVASIIADGWDEGTQRNNKCRAWAGGLLQAKWTPDEVRELFEAVFDVAGVDDEQATKDLGAVERTISTFESGERITGFGSLVSEGLVDAAVVRRVEHHCRTPDTLALELKIAGTTAGKATAERLLREAQDTDKLGAVADEIAEAIIARDASESQSDPNDTPLGRIADLSTDVEPLDYVCPGLSLAPGKISALCGYPGTAKGVLLGLIALCVAAGIDCLGNKTNRRRVAVLDFETGKLAETRLKRLARGLWGRDAQRKLRELQDGDWLTFAHARPPITESFLETLETACDQGMLICFDSYTSAVQGEQNESTYADVAIALGGLSLRKGATMLVTAHNRKSTKNGDNTALEMLSGHNALASAIQTALVLNRPDAQDKHAIRVHCARAPEDDFMPFDIKWQDVVDPDAGDTPGARAKGAKWGLRAVLQTKEKALEQTAESAAASFARETAAAEAAIIEAMRIRAPLIKKRASELVGFARAQQEPNRAAIRALVRRGMLLANFHWSTAETGAKQLVWLPRAGAEMGFVQT